MSLNLRIILSATFVLVFFISITAFTLERAFVSSTEAQLKDKLTSQLYALIAAAELRNETLLMPSSELDALLGLPSSGVYAFITSNKNQILWQSSSAIGAKVPLPVFLSSGKKTFNKIQLNNLSFYHLAYGISWSVNHKNLALSFNIITDLHSFNHQITQYRTTLWSWLIAMATLLLISQMLILRWGLSPLRHVADELNLVDAGKQSQIINKYPLEIERLSNNINTLLTHEHQQKTHYRNALGDLAHSLKTPLAVIQSTIDNPLSAHDKYPQHKMIRQQIKRMNTIVEYQLQKAAMVGTATSNQRINIEQTIKRIIASLAKVYHKKQITVLILVADATFFKGDEGDLFELLGNLLDNAYKWANKKIEVNAKIKNNKLIICVHDDGAGFKPEQITPLLQRGKRADENTAGHGIGLSIVNSIVNAYQGELLIDKSKLGGANVCIKI